jgi:ribosomal-protein-serine acetyltransferase
MIIKADDTITLELIDDKHAAPVFDLIDNNRHYLRAWLPWVDNMRGIDNFKNYILKCKKESEQGSDFGYVVIHNNVVAGRIGIHNIDQLNKIASIGYWLAKDFAGKGIITKSCKAIIDYAFNVLDLNRIEIKCGTGNFKSKAVPERLGFKQEGIVRQGEFVNNNFIDLFIFSMLKTEWQH